MTGTIADGNGGPRRYQGDLTPPSFPQAACKDRTDLDWLPRDEYTRRAKQAAAVCCRCPHMQACAMYALAHKLPGIWGGLRTDQRQAMARAS